MTICFRFCEKEQFMNKIFCWSRGFKYISMHFLKAATIRIMKKIFPQKTWSRISKAYYKNNFLGAFIQPTPKFCILCKLVVELAMKWEMHLMTNLIKVNDTYIRPLHLNQLFLFQLSKSDSMKVTLHSVGWKTSGLFRCEVSAEKPSFASAQSEARMEVVCKSRNSYMWTWNCIQWLSVLPITKRNFLI